MMKRKIAPTEKYDTFGRIPTLKDEIFCFPTLLAITPIHGQSRYLKHDVKKLCHDFSCALCERNKIHKLKRLEKLEPMGLLCSVTASYQ